MSKEKLKFAGAFIFEVCLKFVMSLFLTIATAVLIILIRKITHYVHDPYFTDLMTIVEGIILTTDSVVLVAWFGASAFKLIKEVVR